MIVVRAAARDYLSTNRSVELRVRPRPLAVSWGREQLMGCRAFEPLPLGSSRGRTQALTCIDNRTNGEGSGRFLWHRLGRGAPRRGAGRWRGHPGRQASDQRRRGRIHRPGAAARRRRRYRRSAHPRGDRDQPRPARRLPAGNRAASVHDQPDGGIALPGPVLGLAQKVRRRRRPGAGEHFAHRPGRAPTPAVGFPTGTSNRGVGPGTARRRMGPHDCPQQAAIGAARVLPGDPRRIRRQAGWPAPQ